MRIRRRLAILITILTVPSGLGLAAVPASAHPGIPAASAGPDIPAGTYEFSNYEQYLTNVVGDGALPGEHVYFTNGPGDGYDSTWQINSHGTVSSSGSTFDVGSGLNAAFNGDTIWELYTPGAELDAGTCPNDVFYEGCLDLPPNNFFVIVSLGSNNYYLVNVHASNRGWETLALYKTPWLLCYAGDLNPAGYDGWEGMSGSRPAGSTITAHQLPGAASPSPSPSPPAAGEC